MSDLKLGLFNGEDKPTPTIVWDFYQRGQMFNTSISFEPTIKVNENFYVGKQWENIDTAGMPTPQINFIKRDVGFVVASITSDNIGVSASALANTVGTGSYTDLINIVNDEFDAIIEQNNLPFMIREFARNAAVDGDGCIYTYWDSEAETGQKAKGRIKSEILDNTQVYFGDPNDRNVQTQPYIIIVKRELVRRARIRAKQNGVKDWHRITPDTNDDQSVDTSKEQMNGDKCTTVLIMWKDDENGDVWAYECARDCEIKKPWNMNIPDYPLVWVNWDYVKDSYHGMALVTSLVNNQLASNRLKASTIYWAFRNAYGKVLYDKSRVARWENRIGAAIPVMGGDINSVVKNIDPPQISPVIAQLDENLITQSGDAIGATQVALGNTRPDNTSAIIALQRSAAVPSEITKQNIYKAIEDLMRIYLDFMAEYYGKRYVDVPPTSMEVQAVMFAQQVNPDLQVPTEVPVLFDFAQLKDHPVKLKLDVGASAYWSDIAAQQSLDNMLQLGVIDVVDYLENVSDNAFPGRRKLLEKKKREMEVQKQQMGMMPNTEAPMAQMAVGGKGGPVQDQGLPMDIPSGGGYGHLQRVINESGDSKEVL